jgi:hypothetical protein
MSSILTWLFKKVILEFLWQKGQMLLDLLFKWIEEYKKRKEIVKENDKQAAIVEAIAEEIKKLINAGQPVPPELYEKLQVESRKLVYRSDVE